MGFRGLLYFQRKLQQLRLIKLHTNSAFSLDFWLPVLEGWHGGGEEVVVLGLGLDLHY